MIFPIFTRNAGIDSYQFENGFKLIMAYYPKAPAARVELVVRVGSKNEGYGQSGMSHLLEHMLFKSTLAVPDVKAALVDFALEWNGYTTADSTHYHENVSFGNVLQALALEYSRLLEASFTEEDLRTEMTVVRNEMELADSNTARSLLNTLSRGVHDFHGYGRTTLGSYSDVQDAPYAQLREFYKRHYRVNNAFLLVTGCFDQEAVLTYVSNHFGSVQSDISLKHATANWTIDRPSQGSSTRSICMPCGKVQAMLGWKMPPMFSREAVALSFAFKGLTSDSNKALYKELVHERKAVVGVNGGLLDKIDGGMAVLMVEGRLTDEPADLARIVQDSFYAYLEHGINDVEMEDARQEELAAYHNVFNRWDLVQDALVDAEIQGDWQWAFARKVLVENVTYEEMMAAARSWLTPDSQVTALLYNTTSTTPTSYKVINPDAFPEYESITPSQGDGSVLKETTYPALHAARQEWVSEKNISVLFMPTTTQNGNVYIKFENMVGTDATRAKHMGTAIISAHARLFGGGSFSGAEWARLITRANANVFFHTTGFSLEAPSATALDLLDKVLEVYHAPLLQEHEFDGLKESIVQSFNSNLISPNKTMVSWLQHLWNDDPKGHWDKPLLLQETLEYLNALDYESVCASLAWMSKPGLARATIVGDVTRENVEMWSNRCTQTYSLAAQAQNAPFEYKPYGAKMVTQGVHRVEMGDGPDGLVMARLSMLSEGFHVAEPALQLAMHVLGGSSLSRLWTRVREKDGVAYSVSSESVFGGPHQPISHVRLWASCPGEKVEHTYASLEQEWQRFVTQGITEDELKDAKSYFFNKYSAAKDQDQVYANVMHQSSRTGKDYGWLNNFLETQQILTLADVNEAIQLHLKDTPIQWATARSAVAP